MRMSPQNCTIHKIEYWERPDGLQQAYVFADFSGVFLRWPDVIEDGKGGKTFAFASNEVLPMDFVGRYSGYARYVEIKEE